MFGVLGCQQHAGMQARIGQSVDISDEYDTKTKLPEY